MITQLSKHLSRPTHLPKLVTENRRSLVVLAILLLTLYVVVPQLHYFGSSLSEMRHASPLPLLAAFAAMLATYLAAAGVYRTLAKRYLHYGRTVLVQFAGMFANRLLPAGIGAISVNFIYLRKAGQEPPEAAATVAINNVLGLVGHSVLLVLFLVFLSAPTAGFSFNNLHTGVLSWWLVIPAAVVLFGLLQLKQLRRKIINGLRHVLKSIGNYRAYKERLALALLLSVCVTLAYAICLTFSAQAVNLHLALGQALVVLTLGVIGGVAAPTPGGLVGAEAGLVIGLVAYGAPSSTALAAALIYRLLTYWLPLILGGAAFAVARRRRYI